MMGLADVRRYETPSGKERIFKKEIRPGSSTDSHSGHSDGKDEGETQWDWEVPNETQYMGKTCQTIQPLTKFVLLRIVIRYKESEWESHTDER